MPRQQVTIKTVYKLEELDEAAQQKAHEKWAEHNLDYEWWDFCYGMFNDAAKLLGIEIDTRPVKLMGGGTGQRYCIQFGDLYSQGEGASFEGDYRYHRRALAKIKVEFPTTIALHRVALDLQRAQKPFLYKLQARVKHLGPIPGHRIEVWHGDDEYRDIPKLAREHLAQALQDFMSWMNTTLKEEYEYLQSFEQFKEACGANGYEFDDQGDIA
jgi:hypothetical protein